MTESDIRKRAGEPVLSDTERPLMSEYGLDAALTDARGISYELTTGLLSDYASERQRNSAARLSARLVAFLEAQDAARIAAERERDWLAPYIGELLAAHAWLHEAEAEHVRTLSSTADHDERVVSADVVNRAHYRFDTALHDLLAAAKEATHEG